MCRPALLVLLLLPSLSCIGAPEPLRLDAAQLAGTAFDDPRAELLEESSESGTVEARDLLLHQSADRCLQTGVYRTGRNLYTDAEPYPHDEFMYFLEGGVTLRSASGRVTEIVAGDAVLLPKGWVGTWDSPGYRKIYVIYGCP